MTPILTIGQAAETTGVPTKTIRYYEAIGLVPPARRTTTGYRQYDESAVDRLRLIRRARLLKLPLRQLRTLMSTLNRNGGPRNALRPRLLALVEEQISAVMQEIAELELLRQQLEQVSRAMRASARRRVTGPCRCLEVEDGGKRHNKRPRPPRLRS